MNARRYLCFGRACHSHCSALRPELLILARCAARLALTCCHLLRGFHLLLRKKHELELLDLPVQLVKHVLLHGQHLVLYLQLLFCMLFCNLLNFDLSLQLGHLASIRPVLLLQIEDLLFHTLHLGLLPRQVVLFELLFRLLQHHLREILLLKVVLRIFDHV